MSFHGNPSIRSSRPWREFRSAGVATGSKNIPSRLAKVPHARVSFEASPIWDYSDPAPLVSRLLSGLRIEKWAVAIPAASAVGVGHAGRVFLKSIRELRCICAIQLLANANFELAHGLERDDFSSSRHPALLLLFERDPSESRHPPLGPIRSAFSSLA